MAKGIRQRVEHAAIEVLSETGAAQVSAVRFMGKLRERLPDVDPAYLRYIVRELPLRNPLVQRPARGWYRLCPPDEVGAATAAALAVRREKKDPRCGEGRFYAGLADYLRELEGLRDCIAVGGRYFGESGGTPDVIGIGSSARSRSCRVVSAELKTDVNRMTTGFGQACIYRLFSHVSYLAVPRAIRLSELARIDEACQMFGIGLILFDHLRPGDPSWEVRHQPGDAQPPMRQLAEKLMLLEEMMPEKVAA